MLFIAVLDNTGAVVVKYVYDAWGNHAVLDADGNDIEDANHIGNLNPFRYRGYYYDVETGLYFLQTRYYDPETGRFISQDSIEYAEHESINGLNLYAYCGNNPVMNIDPTGTFFLACVIAGLIIGAVVGGVIGGVTAAQNGATGWELVGAIFCGAIVGGVFGAVAGAFIGVGGAMIGSGLGMIGGAGGFAALVGGGVVAAGAAAGLGAVVLGGVVVGGGIAIAGLGVHVVFASANRPGNNQVQNKQMRDALRELGQNPNDPYVKDIINDVEKYIRDNRLNLGYKKLKELLRDFFG